MVVYKLYLMETKIQQLIDSITEYLSHGGLVNPELMEHDKVRDLLTECRKVLENPLPLYLAPGVKISDPSLKEVRILPKPIPATERLPEAADCDSKGLCWLTTTETEPGWVLDNPEQCTGWAHWLPFQSLPLVK